MSEITNNDMEVKLFIMKEVKVIVATKKAELAYNRQNIAMKIVAICITAMH